MKRIYLHTTDKEKQTAIEKICFAQGIEMKNLSGMDTNRTIAMICGMQMKNSGGHRQAPPLYVLPEIMLFYGIDDPSLDRFLDAYKESSLKPIRKKAIVTPTNLGWTLYELAEELAKESA